MQNAPQFDLMRFYGDLQHLAERRDEIQNAKNFSYFNLLVVEPGGVEPPTS
jgi:hypothetical protein